MMLARACTAVGLLLALAGCTLSEKRYMIEPTLPDGERLSGRWSPTYQHSLVVSYPVLDVDVAGGGQVIATWFSPGPLPPLIPIPTDAWNRARQVEVFISFVPYKKGYAFSPMRTWLQEEGAPAVQAEKWREVRIAGARRPHDEPPSARIEDDEISIDARTSIGIVFPVPAPLEGRAEVRFEGLRRDGLPVAVPVVPFWPKYQMKGTTFP